MFQILESHAEQFLFGVAGDLAEPRIDAQVAAGEGIGLHLADGRGKEASAKIRLARFQGFFGQLALGDIDPEADDPGDFSRRVALRHFVRLHPAHSVRCVHWFEEAEHGLAGGDDLVFVAGVFVVEARTAFAGRPAGDFFQRLAERAEHGGIGADHPVLRSSSRSSLAGTVSRIICNSAAIRSRSVSNRRRCASRSIWVRAKEISPAISSSSFTSASSKKFGSPA